MDIAIGLCRVYPTPETVIRVVCRSDSVSEVCRLTTVVRLTTVHGSRSFL